MFCFWYTKSLRHKDRRKYGSNTADLSNILRFEASECFCLRCSFTPMTTLNRVPPPGVLSSAESLGDCDQTNACEKYFLASMCAREMEFNRVNCLVWELHQSSRDFSSAIQEIELDKTGSQLAMAWIGVDVHAWHKNTAYQVSAVGHAAIFAAIKKYAPYLIPSPYTSERLGLVRQLKRIKKHGISTRNSVEDASSTVN